MSHFRDRLGGALAGLGRRLHNLGAHVQIEDGLRLRRSKIAPELVARLRQIDDRWVHGPRTVLDVGANVGQFARVAAAAFPAATIHSFEPTKASFEQLSRACREIGARAHAHQLALGAKDGTATIAISGHSASSSLYEMSPVHIHEFPGSAPVGTEEIALARLDAWAAATPLERPIVLKLDVQGAELDVLEGAGDVLDRVALVMAELSVDELYLEGARFDEVIARLAEAGFQLREILAELRSPATSRLLSVDGVFVRSDPG